MKKIFLSSSSPYYWVSKEVFPGLKSIQERQGVSYPTYILSHMYKIHKLFTYCKRPLKKKQYEKIKIKENR